MLFWIIIVFVALMVFGPNTGPGGHGFPGHGDGY